MHDLAIDYAPLTDDELVELSQKGNDLAFADLVRRHRVACFKLALSILKDKCDAEDEVQNAVWKAFEHIDQFHRDAKFTTWLTRIVVNQCLMRLRQQKRARLLYIEDAVQSEDQITLDLTDHSEDPEQQLGRVEIGAMLQTEIRRIPPLLREVFVLREVQDLSMPEVAQRLGITIAAAKSRLLRARTELRCRLLKHGGRSGPAFLLG